MQRGTKEENREDGESPAVESTGECASTSPLFRSTPGEPRRTPASDYTGCVSMACTWSLTRARTGPKSIYTCVGAVHESEYYAMRYTTPTPVCLNGCSPRAGPHSHAIFRILPLGMSNDRAAFRISHKCTKVRVTRTARTFEIKNVRR